MRSHFSRRVAESPQAAAVLPFTRVVCVYGGETVNHGVCEFAIGGALNDGTTGQEFFIATVSVNTLDVEKSLTHRTSASASRPNDVSSIAQRLFKCSACVCVDYCLINNVKFNQHVARM